MPGVKCEKCEKCEQLEQLNESLLQTAIQLRLELERTKVDNNNKRSAVSHLMICLKSISESIRQKQQMSQWND